MTKFKIGDKVICNKNDMDLGSGTIVKTRTLDDLIGGKYPYEVLLDKCPFDEDDPRLLKWAFNDSELKLKG